LQIWQDTSHLKLKMAPEDKSLPVFGEITTKVKSRLSGGGTVTFVFKYSPRGLPGWKNGELKIRLLE
jgi:hypothetical protein